MGVLLSRAYCVPGSVLDAVYVLPLPHINLPPNCKAGTCVDGETKPRRASSPYPSCSRYACSSQRLLQPSSCRTPGTRPLSFLPLHQALLCCSSYWDWLRGSWVCVWLGSGEVGIVIESIAIHQPPSEAVSPFCCSL